MEGGPYDTCTAPINALELVDGRTNSGGAISLMVGSATQFGELPHILILILILILPRIAQVHYERCPHLGSCGCKCRGGYHSG